MIHYIALITALALSIISGSMSVVGLTVIFAGAYWQVLIMGSVLEGAKLVSVSWLYRHWNIAPKLIKYYLSIVIVVLMLINSAGVFGFLSRAHIEQFSQVQTEHVVQIDDLKSQIKLKQLQSDDFSKQILLIDNATQKLVDTKRVSQALNVEKQRHAQRDSLIVKKQDVDLEISKLQNKENELLQDKTKLEADIGPIKYVAMLIFGNSNTDNTESAVRIMILILVLVCDPTAVILLMAANHGMKHRDSLTFKPAITITDKAVSFDNAFERLK